MAPPTLLLRTTSVVCLLGSLAIAGEVRRVPPAATTAAPDLASHEGEDWGGFLGPTGDGRSSLTTMAVPWPDGGPRIAWHVEMGEGYCAPAVALGRVLVFDRVGRDVRLRCLRADTAAKIWEERYPTDYVDSFGYDGGPRAAPVIAGDRVVSFGPEGRLVCRSLADGAAVWQVDTTAGYHVVQNFFGVGAAPLVLEVDGRQLVIVQVGGSPPGSAPPAPERLDLVRGADSGLVAFDLASGAEVWRASDQLASYSAPVLARIAGTDRVLAWMRDDLVVVDPATGAVQARFRWRADELFSAIAASPVVRGDEILLTECYAPGSVLLDLSGAEPRPLRQDRRNARPDRALKSHWSTPVVRDDHVYGQSGRNSGDACLVCVEWKTGAIRWSEGGFGRASVVLVGGHLVVLGEYGDLALVEANPERYVEVSRARLVDAAAGRRDLLAPPCWAAPVVARGACFVRGQGRLVCLDLEAGADR